MIIAFRSKLLLLMQILVIFALSPLALLFIVPPVRAEIMPTIFPTVSSSTTSVKKIEIRSGMPVRLWIPKIGVDASFEHVKLTSFGVMDAPKGPSNVAWFEDGPRPGEKGTAVINGHYGWRDGIPAVFDKLNRIVKGDKIYVVDDKAEIMTFIVIETRIYNEKDGAFGVFNSIDSKAHLNIITCEGAWNSSLQRYQDRFVVFAEREE